MMANAIMDGGRHQHLLAMVLRIGCGGDNFHGSFSLSLIFKCSAVCELKIKSNRSTAEPEETKFAASHFC
jgi:hypothetical protein